ncbi:MAG: hypothetical protein R3293_18675 [Candidatus Promineifilaceae bacterium]|nr:hypothetical protein [Candidatus Promineifilaceae bacterium]
MISSESMIQSFVIKIWLEETSDETGQTLWRGHITHIPSMQRVYLKKLSEIIPFISPYMEQMGIDLNHEST